ncbi:MAG: hypothetical protein R3C28_00420 [Pirellulaceae bacterium]
MWHRGHYGWPATHLDPVVWSTMMGFCFLASLDMWTILGDGPLWRRSLISLAIGLVCGMGLTVGWWPHATTAERLAIGGYVASQRLFVLAASAVLSVIAQLCSRRRLTFRPNQKRSAVSIADIMVCTMLVAVAISVFIRMYRCAEDGEAFARLARHWAINEVIFVAVILLLPTFFFFHWRLFPLTTLFAGMIEVSWLAGFQ